MSKRVVRDLKLGFEIGINYKPKKLLFQWGIHSEQYTGSSSSKGQCQSQIITKPDTCTILEKRNESSTIA